ncbi:MAG: tetratricopeptide repeat protein [Methanothrix sp.]|nr:MAG: tetratricopeptide repeat protein [Methanothrix sp.]
MDLRDSKGAIIRPTGPVEQRFGDTYNSYIQQTEKFPVPHQIPSPPKNFTGREELIEQILTGFDQGRTIIGLRGIGGLGKTALAYKLVELLRDRYKDGQLIVNMQGTSITPFTPSQAMSKLLRYYYPNVSLPESQDELQSLYLSTLDSKCALILLDNALDEHQVRPLLPPSTCGLIITSRRKLALSDVFPIDLEFLKFEDAVELLLKTARPHSCKPLPQEGHLWKEIARMCGCLPVALKAAGSYLACTPGSSPSKYIKELQDERKRLGIIGKEGVEEDLVTKFSLSYSRLAPETAQVFRLLSIFPADFDAQAEGAVCRDRGHRHLIELVRWSLVEYQRPSLEDEGRYHLHDLVRLFAAGRLEAEEGGEAAGNDAQQRHAEHFRDVLSSATESYQNGNALVGLSIFDLERINIEAAWAWAKRNFAGSNAAASICNDFLNWPYLLELRMHPRERISWLETALAAARQLKDRGLEGVHLGNLGWAYAALGDARKAIDYSEQALKIGREIGDRRNEGNWLGNLGLAYADLGEMRKAIDYYQQHLAIAREIGNRRGEGTALGNLGRAYAYLGKTRKAIGYYEQALAIHCEIGDKRNEGAWLGNLGNAYKNLGETRKAIEYHEQALAIDREIGDKKGEGADLGNLGSSYYLLSETRKALDYYDQQFDITHEIGNRYGEANSLWGQAICYKEMNSLDQAIDKAEEALNIFEQIESPCASTMRELLSKWRSK